jgi:hypothetical protein
MSRIEESSLFTPRGIAPQLALLIVAVGLAALALGGPATDETPIGPAWWPSEWGPDDQRGAANRITPAKVLEASQLIERGQIYQLGRL